jgi:putative transposase
MTLYQNYYRIESSRLQFYDYSSNGYYFITICVKNNENFFGEISNSVVTLNELGQMAQKCWLEIPNHFPFVKLDEFIIIPNHVHGIIIIDKPEENLRNSETHGLTKTETHGLDNVETQNFASLHWFTKKNKFGPQSKNLSSIIRGYKIGVTKYAKNNNIIFKWLERFYDVIIRDEEHLK